MPFYIPRSKLRESPQPNFRNSCWEQWGNRGTVIGLPLIVTGTALSVVEIVRIIYGITNRGLNNYVNDGRAYVADDSNLWPIGSGQTPIKPEKFHYWPWSYAANLFGLVAIIAGVCGIVSAYRRSYSSLFSFMTFSLLSSLLGGYLVGYYAILLNYYLTYGFNNWNLRTGTIDTSFGLCATNLAFSMLLVCLGAIGFVMAYLGINGCQAKGLHLDQVKNSYTPRQGPTGQIVPTSYLG
jgi:hypothetical protein